MNSLESISEKLGITTPWVEKGGVHWLEPGTVSVRTLVQAMNAIQARFITITAYQLPGSEGFRLEYHWDLNGQLLGFPFLLTGNTIESIYDICEAADWIEREVHEGFAVDFIGREYEPLQLRADDKPGFNLREEAK
ncbi:MAG: NADH-quinone oxidoreductase subunit C [Terracidiphilus sp.]|nr:NADH-quinone oxidoreductase subunit C [Terracidiphilus sp.]MDR3776878.1 NADH-quinone oxidoreductase subunit C [Terracidiphilus sp.]